MRESSHQTVNLQLLFGPRKNEGMAEGRALKRYWTRGDESGLQADWRERIRLILS